MTKPVAEQNACCAAKPTKSVCCLSPFITRSSRRRPADVPVSLDIRAITNGIAR